MRPDLASFDVLLINTSGGKDSQTTLRRVVRLAEKAGLRDRLVAVHADLGEVEWDGTPELAERQVAHYGIRFEKVRREQGDLLSHIKHRGMFPDAARRYCTSDHKRGPVRKLITRLAAEVRERERQPKKRVRVLNIMGMRAQESISRAKRPAYSLDEGATSSRREVWEWLPIHAWTVEQVWADIHASGVPYHPAYDLGMPRLSCRFCVLSSRSALVLAAQHNPELARKYERLEADINHRFRKTLSMSQLITQAKCTAQIKRVEDWAA